MSIDKVTPAEWDSLTKALDNVNRPAHYNKGSIEAIEYIKQQLGDDGFISYCMGNCHKYLHRYKYKNGIEDLQKGRWYLSKVIEVLSAKSN